jgi:hypothetical protein
MARLSDPTDAVRAILLADWDPIGIRDVPQAADEYDEYAPPIAKMLADEASIVELSRYLLEIETETLGLKGDPVRARRVAEALSDIG